MLSHHSHCPRARRRVLAALPALALLGFAAAPAVAAAQSADLATTVTPSFIRAYVGESFSFTIQVTNDGPDPAAGVSVSDNWYYASTFAGVSATAPSGVTCTAPPTGSRGTVTCTTPSLGRNASMTIAVRLHVLGIHNMILSDTATATSTTPDPNTANNTASAWVRIA